MHVVQFFFIFFFKVNISSVLAQPGLCSKYLQNTVNLFTRWKSEQSCEVDNGKKKSYKSSRIAQWQ